MLLDMRAELKDPLGHKLSCFCGGLRVEGTTIKKRT